MADLPQRPLHTPVLPDFCQPSMLISGLILSQLLAFVMIVSPMGVPGYKLQALLNVSGFSLIVTFTSLGILCFAQRWLLKFNHLLATAASYFLVLLVTAICSHLAWIYVVNTVVIMPDEILIKNVLPEQGRGIKIRVEQGVADIVPIKYHVFLIRNMLVSAVVGLVGLRYLHLAYSWQIKTEAEAEFRVQALQSRIHPHFLFNSMNTIASLTRIDPVLAEEAVVDLSSLFRATLADARKRVTLADEIHLCQQYLHIEGLRLGKRLKVKWLTEAAPQDALVPSLSLQPLIENAIHYGIQPHPDGGVIQITAMSDGHDIRIDVENRLPPPDAEVEHKGKGNHIALDNLRQRLQVYYDKEGRLDIVENDNGTYRVSLRFPYETVIKSSNIRGLNDT